MADERVLDAPPALPALFARAGAGALPLASNLPFLAGGGETLPDLTLRLDAAAIERERLARYARVCGFSLRDAVPATFPHVLAFPLQLALMTDRDFPFPAIGLVHIANRITQHRTLRAGETVALRVWAGELEPHPRGRQFSLHSEARVGEELVWEEVSTNLRRESGGGAGERSEHHNDADEPVAMGATWRLPGDLGRRYGAVSGDVNPIHMHPLSARLFGFPRAIAHGMWTKARCLAALEARLPERFTVEVAFRKPILLPGTVGFGVAEKDTTGELAFEVRDPQRDSLHLRGSLRPA